MTPQRPDGPGTLTNGTVVLSPREGQPGRVAFDVEHDGEQVGSVAIDEQPDAVGRLTWSLHPGYTGRGFATMAVSVLVDYAFRGLRLHRVEAYVDPHDQRAMRVATRSGLRREGLARGHGVGAGGRSDRALYARLATDPPISEAGGFRELLNSFLPRKRAIAQMLIRDDESRVLLCRLTYKADWDLPGGVVEVGESPQAAVSREVEEELGLQVPAGRLLLTDWLPPWGGWDDALCLVFDGGVVDSSVVDRIVVQPREITSAHLCTPAEVREHAADFTARRIEAALAHRDAPGAYTESGRG